jgi:hypothetical protein
VTTTYSYTNTTGELIGIDYSDATPDVAFAGPSGTGKQCQHVQVLGVQRRS